MNFKELFDEINSGKYNMIFLIIVGFLLFHIYFQLNDKKVESMADVSNDQIATAVRNYYLSDEFIKNISAVSAQIQRDGLIISGNLTVNGSFNIIPRGTIVAFNSVTAPAGWALCNGSNGTPDLRGRFILGLNPAGGKNAKVPGDDYNKLGGIGGNQIHQLTEGEMPVHTHTYKDAWWAEGDGTEGDRERGSGRTDWDNKRFVMDRTSDPRGGNDVHNNMPPFYVLSYIMKL